MYQAKKNNKNYIVEIVMVAFNSEETIKSSILSVFTQTFSSWKLVIINDGSTDKTQKIIDDTCELIQSNKIKKIIFKENKGLSFRLSEFKAGSNSLFIARIDADDIWLPQKLNYQMRIFFKDPKLIALGSSALIQNKDNKFDIRTIKCYSNSLLNRIILPFKNTFVHSSLIIRKSAFEKVNGYSSLYKYSQDYFLLLNLLKVGKLLSVKQPLVILTKSKNQISYKYKKDQIFFVLKAQRAFKYSENHIKVSKFLNDNKYSKKIKLIYLIFHLPYLIRYLLMLLFKMGLIFLKNCYKK